MIELEFAKERSSAPNPRVMMKSFKLEWDLGKLDEVLKLKVMFLRLKAEFSIPQYTLQKKLPRA